jgi:hypothetical protein
MLWGFLLAIVIGIIAVVRRLNRMTAIQRAAAIAAGADVNAVSRWRCEGCGMTTGHEPTICIRCQGITFNAVV